MLRENCIVCDKSLSQEERDKNYKAHSECFDEFENAEEFEKFCTEVESDEDTWRTCFPRERYGYSAIEIRINEMPIFEGDKRTAMTVFRELIQNDYSLYNFSSRSVNGILVIKLSNRVKE